MNDKTSPEDILRQLGRQTGTGRRGRPANPDSVYSQRKRESGVRCCPLTLHDEVILGLERRAAAQHVSRQVLLERILTRYLIDDGWKPGEKAFAREKEQPCDEWTAL